MAVDALAVDARVEAVLVAVAGPVVAVLAEIVGQGVMAVLVAVDLVEAAQVVAVLVAAVAVPAVVAAVDTEGRALVATTAAIAKRV